MFTGIVEEVGQIISTTPTKLSIKCSKVLDDVKVGDSIAVNGVCLTVTSFDKEKFSADVSYETKKVTTLNRLNNGDNVNLERALLANSRFGGHIVSGHVDCVGKLTKLEQNNEFYKFEIEFPSSEYSQYYVKKGSISVDGISLTIADTYNDTVSVAVIPHTFKNTNLCFRKIGDYVNIEFDILSKYVEKNFLIKYNKSNITEDFLKDNGFM